MCGGSIVGSNKVITAGHCCDGMSASKLGVEVVSVLHPGPHHFVPGILTKSFGRVFSSFAPGGFQPIGGSVSTSTASWSVAFLCSMIERRGTIASPLISETVSWRGSSWPLIGGLAWVHPTVMKATKTMLSILVSQRIRCPRFLFVFYLKVETSSALSSFLLSYLKK